MGKKTDSDLVRFELVPPQHAFQFCLPENGEVIRIDEAGYTTADPLVIAELDQHPLYVQRAGR